jgi:glycosyltransferase involved in cell wall biosynthesis
MNIGIDITSLLYDRGVSRYTANLVRALVKRRDVNVRLYGSAFRNHFIFDEFFREVEGIAPHRTQRYFENLPPKIHEFIWGTLKMQPVKNVMSDIEVFHSWDWLQPPDKNLPLVSTIHDLAILKFPETAHPKILEMHQKSWQVLKERNAEIIAVSHATRKDVIELLEFPAHKVHVVHEALPLETVQVSEKLSEEEHDAIKVRLGLDKPYLLFVGTREPRKNLLRLIEAWQELSKEYQLIIAGEKGWDETEQQSTLLRNPELRFLGKVSNKELAVLYGEAEVFVYPSLYEGFGLPILEAFYHGTPVVTSNISSMPEVCGNAAELIDPMLVTSIRKGIQKVLNENNDEQQKRMQRMIIRLHLFDWNHVADETMRVYQRAVAE